MRHDGEGGPGSQHLDCGYNIEVSRASATRGSMPPLQVPYGAEMGPHGPMMPAFQPRASTTAAATNSSYYGSGSAARPTPASSASSTSAYNYGWSTTAPSSGDYDEYYSRDASIQQPYYPMETVMGYAPWSAAGSGAASRSRSGAVSGTGSMYVHTPPATTMAHHHILHPAHCFAVQQPFPSCDVHYHQDHFSPAASPFATLYTKTDFTSLCP